MKTKEELNALKNEVKALNKKLAELTEEELEQVAGGTKEYFTLVKCSSCGYEEYYPGDVRGWKFVCPSCYQKTFEGISGKYKYFENIT